MISVLVFTSEFFQKTCAEFGIVTREIPCESHNSLGPGEGYHAPLRKIYRKLKEEQPELDPSVQLSISVHALNNIANPRGLIPSLFVFSSVPKITLGNTSHLSLSQKQGFAAMESARKEMEKIVAEQKLKLAGKLRTRGMDVFSICPGSHVLVYREKKKI